MRPALEVRAATFLHETQEESPERILVLGLEHRLDRRGNRSYAPLHFFRDG
ncbi:hypothetical protein D3C83_321070 [compost metagenome]